MAITTKVSGAAANQQDLARINGRMGQSIVVSSCWENFTDVARSVGQRGKNMLETGSTACIMVTVSLCFQTRARMSENFLRYGSRQNVLTLCSLSLWNTSCTNPC